MDSATHRFIDRFGHFFEQEGLPRIAGRMTALLLVSDEPRSLDDIADTLQVSKASVSTDARRLESRGFVVGCTRPGDRRDYYAIAPDGFRTMLRARIESLHRFGALLAEAHRLPVARDAVRERMTEWTDFHEAMIDAMSGLLVRWDARSAALADTATPPG
jgi:DNA-binding transcriptional regulator GbsR (MarR family)